MKKRHWARKITALVLAVGLAITGIPNTSFKGTEVVEAAESYSLSVKTHSATVEKGDTITLEAVVKDSNGNRITNLNTAGLKLWWYTDIWASGHTDGNNDAKYSKYDDNSGLSLSADVTFPSVGTYYVTAKIEGVQTLYIPITVTESSEAASSYSVRVTPSSAVVEAGEDVKYTAIVTNATGEIVADLEEAGLRLYWWEKDAEADDGNSEDGYSLTGTFKWTKEGEYWPKLTLQSADWENTYVEKWPLKVEVVDTKISYDLSVEASKKSYITPGETVSLSANYTSSDGSEIVLGSDGYKLVWSADESLQVVADNQGATPTNATPENALENGLADKIKVTLPNNKGEYNVTASLKKDDVEIAKYVIELSSKDIENIYVKKVDNMSKDFIKGVDISSFQSLMDSGVQFYDFNGEPVDEQGFFNLLAANGVNWVRIRVWNNPYDDDGNGYGGGNCDLEKAIAMGKLATEAGMKVLIDFHYSDTWADPGRQLAPREWKEEEMDVDARIAAIETYTKDSLTALYNAGVDVQMVQIGNETSNTICDIKATEGDSYMEKMCEAFNSGAKGARAAASAQNKTIKIAIHIESPQQEGKYAKYAKALADFNVDYDVFASSYYPMWHGTLDNLNSVLSDIATTYNKDVMVAETSWSYTLDDGDGWGNEVSEYDDYDNYEYSVQGQANELYDVVKTMTETTRGLGVFYWEPAWIPVNNVYDDAGNYRESALKANKEAWEKYGSGWATKSCASYDPDHVGANGEWAGGSSVDNHAWFDFDGYPLASLKIFKYLSEGNTTLEKKIWKVSVDDVTGMLGQTMPTPDVTVRYNYGPDETITNVNWNEDEIADAVEEGVGTYTIHGTVEINNETIDASYNLKIVLYNYLLNASFEDKTDNSWTIEGDSNILSVLADNPHEGENALKYNGALSDVGAYQVVTLNRGVYKFGAYLQGREIADGENFQIYVGVGNQTKTAEASPAGWAVWQNPEVTDIRIVKDGTQVVLGCKMTTTSGAWGTWDDFYLNKVDDVEHQIVKVDAKNPTCTEAGNIEYYKCNECGEIYRDAAGTVAITEADTVVAATGHSWNEGVVTTPATATSKGIKTYTCTVCGATRTEEVDYVAPQPDPQPQPQPQPQPEPQPEVEAQSQSITGVKTSYTKTYGNKAFSLGAKAKTTLTYSSSNKKVVTVDKNGKVTIKGAGNAVITIKAKATDEYKAATKKVKITVNKAKQTIKVSVSGKTYKVNDLKKKKKTFNIKASAKTSLTYKVVGSTKYISVSKNGVVTVKKGAKKGTYKIIVTAKSSTNYKSATKTITIKVK